MTAQQFAADMQAANPQHKFAYHKDGHSIALFVSEWNRYAAIAGTDPSGQWVQLGAEILVNGQPVYTDADWNPIP